jgi:CO dehydrogenase/acetyl-CoA synthase gamma subunit (corrinoid Fe-S protein)
MIKLIRKPNIDMQVGIKVYKDTVLTYESEYVKQEIKDLVLHSITTVKGDGFKSTYDTQIELKEGDVLVFEEDSRGYIKPVEEFMTITEAIEELNNIKDLDTEV